MDEKQFDLLSIQRETKKLHASVHRQYYGMDAAMNLHSCWHRHKLNSDAVFQYIWKRKSRYELE